MLFSTTSQFVVLALLLLIGWLFGFVSHPGGELWKRRYQEEGEKYAAYRDDADNEIRQANHRIAELEASCASLEQRNVEAEATIADLNSKLDVPASPALPVTVATPVESEAPPPPKKGRSRPIAETHAAPVIFGKGPNEGGTGLGSNDDLTRIRGIDPALSTRLFGLGVVRFSDIQKLTTVDEMVLEQRLGLPPGFVSHEQWRNQAAQLLRGR
jgi:predicted flap endonuclease-1-like 5' DNA nuclease